MHSFLHYSGQHASRAIRSDAGRHGRQPWRTFAATLLAAALLAVPLARPTAAASSPRRINLDGLLLYADVAPEVEGGRTFVPIRFLAEAMGLKVDWQPAQRLVLADWPATQVIPGGTPVPQPAGGVSEPQPVGGTPAGEEIRIFVAGQWLHPDVPPYIRDGRVMVPIRFIAEALGLQVAWAAETGTVMLQSANPDRSYEALMLNRTPASAWLADMDGDGQKDIVAVYAPEAGQPTRVQIVHRWTAGWEVGPTISLAGFERPDRVELVSGIGFQSLVRAVPPQVHLGAGADDRLLLYRAAAHTWVQINWWVYRPDRDLTAKIPAAPLDGRDRIVIVKGQNLLYFFQQGTLSRILPIATGRTTDLTPEGVFSVAVKAIDPAWRNPEGRIVPGGIPENPLGSRWLGLAVNGDDGSNYGVHGTNAPLSIGTYASSGCVRVLNEQVEDLYELVRVGTTVEIRP
ncbi:MAG: stalk domain-containing protein [Symbiobacteriia bacterium]